MQRLMVRKQKMYDGMREASFVPGAGLTLMIALVLYVIYYLLREIPAFLIDMVYYSGQNVTSDMEAKQVIHEYVTAPGTMVISLALTSLFLALTVLYVRKIEKRPLSTIGFTRERMFGRFSGGYILGLALFALAALPELLMSNALYKGTSPVAVLFILGYIILAISEEAFFRGYMLSTLTAKTGAIPAVLISSAMFALLQISNFGASGLMILEMFLSGVLYAFYTLRTGSLWGAIGIHAAWNFAYGLVSPVVMGELSTDYSMFDFGKAGGAGGGELYNIIFIIVSLAAIAAVVFAGENRLAVPLTDERRMYLSAKKAAGIALAGVRGEDGIPLKKYAYAVADAVYSDEAKAAAMLYIMRAEGVRFEEAGYSPEVLGAAEALFTGKGVAKDHLAHEIKPAASKCRYTMREKYIKYARQAQGKVYCPLMRRELEEPLCAETMRSVDDKDSAGLFGVMDLSICTNCSQRSKG